jgi:hypothetical protein
MSDYEKHVWPATGIREESRVEDYDWGYLYIYSDGRLPEFQISETPSETEIRKRWGHYLR